jgi:hypothetical protein
MIKHYLVYLCLLIGFIGHGQSINKHSSDSNFIESLLKQYPAYFQDILNKRDSFNVQIIYTQINRDKHNNPNFKEYQFNLHNNQYFYPASTVKMPIAFLALEKLNELAIPRLSKSTIMVTDSVYPGQTIVYTQPNAANGLASIENYIKQIFLVSDNDAFNRLFEFLGQEYIQQKLTEKGYPDAMIRHRLNVFLSDDQNRATNPIYFYDSSGNIIYQQPGVYSKAQFQKRTIQLGKGYYKGDNLINQPFDFSVKNSIYLQDQHHILQSVYFPKSMPFKQRFNLTDSDQAFVQHFMSAFPRESSHPYYDSAIYYDAYCKFLLYGSKKGALPNNIRIFNKVGDAYGFLTDIAYIVDLDNKVEFMLSATISCNSDGIYNDDKYDYDTVGYPFMQHLGEVILKYEQARKRKYPPNLSKFSLSY